MPSEAHPQDTGQGVIVICILLGLLTPQRFPLGHGSEKGKMAEPSLFAQRLQAITERCRLREKILATRRELEEERLRAQRLKRKSLRDRWLMEGMSVPTEDHNHTPPAWEGQQSRIQELEQDLSSLESQMQQLDNPELLQERQTSKAPAKAVKEALGISSSPPPEGRSGIESSLEPAPVPSKRTVRAVAEEKLQNGEMSEDGLFGIQPALQSQTPNEVHPSHQRKLAVEEMVIRDHLGQAVGSMDAVGQKQSSIQKELEDDVPLGNRCKERNTSGPLCGEEEPSSVVEGKIDGELGSRDGPEGESPTSWDQEGPSKPLKDENISLEFSKEQVNGELFREVVLLEDGGKRLPEEGVQDHRPSAEPVLNGKQYQLNMESLQDSGGTEITAQEQAGKNLESLQEQPKPSFPDQNPPESEVSLQNPIILSSTSEQTSHILQETKGSLSNPVSFVQETEGPLLETETTLLPNQKSSTVLDQMIHLVESQGSVGAQIPSLVQESYLDPSLPSQQDHFSSPVKQKPSQGVTTSLEEAKLSLLEQIPLHGADGCHLYQIPTSLQEQSASLPSESLPPSTDQLTSLPEKISSSLEETESSPIVLATLEVQEASVVEVEGCTPDVISSLINNHASLANEISSSQEAKGVSLEEIPVKMQDQMATSPMTQSPSLPEADGSLPGKQCLSSMNENECLLLEETSTSTPDQVPPVPKEPVSSQEKTPSLPEQREPLLPSLTTPSLPEPGKAQSPLGEERPTTLQSQASPVGEVEECQGKQIPQSLAEERSTLPDQSPSTHRVPNPALQETGAVLDALCSSSQDPIQPLLETAATMDDQAMEEDGSVSRASRAEEAVESLDILENVPTEEQPLLNELKASEMSAGDQEPKPLVLKSQAAPSQEVPTYHTSSANTASSRQLLPHEGEGHDQGQSRRKQKSCQCCSVM